MLPTSPINLCDATQAVPNDVALDLCDEDPAIVVLCMGIVGVRPPHVGRGCDFLKDIVPLLVVPDELLKDDFDLRHVLFCQFSYCDLHGTSFIAGDCVSL